jgi:hypothetical protein
MPPLGLSDALPALVPQQEVLQPFIPTVVGNVDYREWKKTLERIDEILLQGRVEESFLRLSLARHQERELAEAAAENRAVHTLSTKEQEGFQLVSAKALRCNLARTLTGEGFRPFAQRLADSPLLQWFCQLSRLDVVRIPGKSQLQRYAGWLPEPDMRKVIDTLLAAATSPAGGPGRQMIELQESLDLEAYFLDTACVKLNIHFPVDWVLLRDAARTLLKATSLIRKRGLKVRMEEPETFLRQMNRLCIEMTHARRKQDGKRQRKATLRKMKKLSKVIARHAGRHREELAQRWAETDLSEGQAKRILERIDVILERLPVAVRQAHERIIGERQVLNAEKVLSLYEGHAAVYVRGKAGAEVEFGSQLLLGELESGLIVDWELVLGNPKADTKLLGRSLERLERNGSDQRAGAVSGDRGFDGKANRHLLEQAEIFNAICPKSPAELRRRMKEERFVELQERRSQTEARISIFKNGFLGNPLLSKGYGGQEIQVGWAVLTHNLWLTARLPRQKRRALRNAG